jgi:SAM-dependent methyltransferase
VTEIPRTATEPDWRGLLDGWDRQQSGYIPQREHMFTLMVDTVHTVLGDDPLVLDLACGPGAVSERLLARLPRARSVAIDMDPVLLAIGRGVFDTLGGRLRWVDQDLRDGDWTKAVGDQPFDAVLTTTALHWLSPENLAATYRRIAAILRPGGLMLNGDRLRFDDRSRTCGKVTDALTRIRDESAFAQDGIDNWDDWWRSVSLRPTMARLVEERERRFSHPDDEPRPTFRRPTLAFHLGALADAGFCEMETIWQDLDRRLLLAVR